MIIKIFSYIFVLFYQKIIQIHFYWEELNNEKNGINILS